MAHELAHVVQQSRGGNVSASIWGADSLEYSAEQAARSITESGPISVLGHSGPVITRQPLSLNRTLVPSQMSDAELEHEINAIRRWLRENPASSIDREELAHTLGLLGQEFLRRHPPSRSAIPGAESTSAIALGVVSATRVAQAEAAFAAGGATVATSAAAAAPGATAAAPGTRDR